jgi:hypothetical protein
LLLVPLSSGVELLLQAASSTSNSKALWRIRRMETPLIEIFMMKSCFNYSRASAAAGPLRHFYYRQFEGDLMMFLNSLFNTYI